MITPIKASPAYRVIILKYGGLGKGVYWREAGPVLACFSQHRLIFPGAENLRSGENSCSAGLYIRGATMPARVF